jgi:hypothetical protein
MFMFGTHSEKNGAKMGLLSLSLLSFGQHTQDAKTISS